MTPVLYSARANHATVVLPGKLVRFGSRSQSNDTICFQTSHEDTCLRWQYRVKHEPQADVELSWQCDKHGEWGLRYWVNLCISAPEGSTFNFDRQSGLLSSSGNEYFQLSVCAAKDPLMVTFHEDVNALLKEYDDKGYFYLGSRGTQGHFAVLRFNLEEAPSMTCRVQLRTPNTNNEHLPPPTRPALPSDTSIEPIALHETPGNSPQDALAAVHDVVAWNHVYDPVNKGSYTVLTRFWNQQKFGGFGIWMNDVMYHALMWSRFDEEKARSNIEAVFAWQTDAGNFPCLVTGNDAWLDRSQPPIVSYVLWCCSRMSRNRDLLEWAFPKLLANHDWWWRRRSLHDTGLVAYGTSLDVGDGLYKGTKLAAKDESSMDNMAVHDPASFDATTGLIQAADVGLNALLALDGEILVKMATLLSRDADATRLAQQNDAHKRRIREWLWDESRGVFANRMMDGQFVPAIAPTSFFPMAAGIASEAQVESLIENYLLAEEKFGGTFMLPSATRDDPAYKDNVYWRGRIWAPLNYWVYEGLRRYGRTSEASLLARQSLALFNLGWQDRECGENYHAESGAITDQPDTDAFYSWGALLPLLSVKEVLDDTPLQGLCLSPACLQTGAKLGPINSHLGKIILQRYDTHWSVNHDTGSLFFGTVSGNLREVVLNDSEFSARLEASDSEETLNICGRLIKAAQLDEHVLKVDGEKLVLPAGRTAGLLSVQFSSSGHQTVRVRES